MNNTVEKWLFGFPKVKWLQYTGEVGKCTSYSCQIFSGFNTPKIIKNRLIVDRVIWKMKRYTFFGTQCIIAHTGCLKIKYPTVEYAVSPQSPDTYLNLTVYNVSTVPWLYNHYRVEQLLWKLRFITGEFFSVTSE